jgi:chromosomal replication initiator protein
MYLAHTMTSASLEQIGRHFGGRDHSTVKHACEKIMRLLETDSNLRSLVTNFRRSPSLHLHSNTTSE